LLAFLISVYTSLLKKLIKIASIGYAWKILLSVQCTHYFCSRLCSVLC